MADYIGVIEFERPLYCKKEVSGKRFASRISETDVLLIFPSIPDDYTPDKHGLATGDLVVPGNSFEGKVFWGMVHSWPEGIFSVEHVPCFFSAAEEAIDAIYSDFLHWNVVVCCVGA